MTAMNRIHSLYSETLGSSLYEQIEWGFDFVRSYKLQQMRDIVALPEVRKK